MRSRRSVKQYILTEAGLQGSTFGSDGKKDF